MNSYYPTYRKTNVLSNVLPTVTTENDTFNDEGTSTSGWTAGNATLLQTGSVLRQTKITGGSNSSMIKTISSFPPNNEDFILYGKVKAKNATNCVSVLWLLNGSKEFSIWFGTTDGTGTYTSQAISIVGTVGNNSYSKLQLESSYDFEANWYEFALHYDYKFSTLECYTRGANGKWTYKGRVACDYFSASTIDLYTTSGSPAGSWIEFDYLTLAQPNLAVIGDSITAGSTLFNPNRASFPSLTDYTSTWMNYSLLYPALRNNFIVNKGVGSQSSTDINSRIADVTAFSPKVVFLHASTNDEALSISKATRSTNIQNSINSINAAGASTVLLNAMYGTSVCSDNTPTPDLRDYMRDWWDNYRTALTGIATHINIMTPMTTSNFQTTAETQSDGLHPKPSGYQLIGEFIKTFE